MREFEKEEIRNQLKAIEEVRQILNKLGEAREWLEASEKRLDISDAERFNLDIAIEDCDKAGMVLRDIRANWPRSSK